MGFTIGPASARSLTSAILALAAVVVVGALSFAAPADFSERDLSAPQSARTAAHLKPVQPAAYSAEETRAAQQDTQDTDEDTSDEGQSDEGVPQAAASSIAAAQNAAAANGDLSYIVHEGDSVGAVASMFHIPAEEILRHNHLSEQSTLHIGQILRIPNPYAAQVRDLQHQITVLTTRNQQQEQQLAASSSRERAFIARIDELRGLNRSLEHDLTMLPWWRRATTGAVTLALVMLGIALVSLIQWLLIRWRFVAVAQANEKLTRLDRHYRIMLARAELRLQQLYGRRRAVTQTSPAARTPEEFELERLGRELKEVLEQELAKLGVQPQPPARRSRFREWLTSGSSPVPVRSDRR